MIDYQHDPDEALNRLAGWFAREIACNEMRWPNVTFPRVFRGRVAAVLVADELCGWPDTESATAYLDELYEWDREA